MRIGKRLFPYPILNNDKLYSQFKKSNFSLQYDEKIEDDEYILKNIKIDLDNFGLLKLLETRKADAVCVVECPQTMFRKNYLISTVLKDIHIPLSDLEGKVMISAFVVANQNIENYHDPDFVDDYEGYGFDIEKYCILAADDGYTNKINFNDENDTLKSSIFLVVKDKTMTDNMSVDFDVNKIIISLPEHQWNIYDKTKKIPAYKNIYFSILVVPSLCNSILQIQKSGEDVDSLRISYNWFDSFVSAYEKKKGSDLHNEEFESLDIIKVVQELFDYPVIKAVDKIFEMSMNGLVGDSNED